MLRVVRRIGIAIGSLVAGSLVVSLIGGMLLGLTGIGWQAGGVVLALASVVLGGLIYRDILRREQRPT